MEELECLIHENIILDKTFRRKKYLAIFFICIGLLTADACFYSLNAQLMLFLQKELDWSPDVAKSVPVSSFIYFGLDLAAGVGGLLADFFLHRFILLVVSYICYLIGIFGLLLLQLNSNKLLHPHMPVLCDFNSSLNNDNTDKKCYGPFIFIFMMLCIGTGVLRVVFFVIGADQVRKFGARCVSIYIALMYGIIQVAGVISYLSVYFYDAIDYTNSTMVFLIGLVSCAIVSCVVFILGRPLYDMRTTNADLPDLFTVMKTIILSRKCNDPELQLYSVYDRAKLKLNGQYNDLVHSVKHLFYSLLLYILMLPACMLLSMVDLVDLQALHMKIPRHYQKVFDKWQVVQGLTIALTAIVYTLISIRYLSRDNVFSYKIRLVCGTVCGVVALCLAGVIESIRLKIFWGNDEWQTRVIPQEITGAVYDAANMSVFCMIPVYVFLGISELLTIVAAIEYVYLSNAPWFRFTVVALIWTVFGIGNGLDRFFISLMNGRVFSQPFISTRLYTKSNNSTMPPVDWQSHLDFFWYTMAAVIMTLFCIFYFLLQKLEPNYLMKSFMGLDERLLVENDDEPDESDEEYE